MPVPAYLSIEGESQGPISSQCGIQEGHEDEILVQAFKHEVMVPTDVQSGQTTGQRMHGPITITKVFDRSSPLIYLALAQGEVMTTCALKWFRISAAGQMEHYFSIELENAIITKVKAYMPNCQDPSQSHFTHLEDVSFSYQKITWRHDVDGTEGADDWNAPA